MSGKLEPSVLCTPILPPTHLGAISSQLLLLYHVSIVEHSAWHTVGT